VTVSCVTLHIAQETAVFRNPPINSLTGDRQSLTDPHQTNTQACYVPTNTWTDNKVRELIAVKVLHTALLNTTVIAFKVLPLGSYAPIPEPSPPLKTILELVLWNGLQSCRCVISDVINVIKMPSFQYFLYLWEQKKVTGARSGE